MARCFAFDKTTAQAISRNLHLQVTCDPDVDPLQLALHSDSPDTFLALPADTQGRVLVARMRRTAAYIPPPPPPHAVGEPVRFEAAGFLGLSDEPIYEELCRPKKWWQKILD